MIELAEPAEDRLEEMVALWSATCAEDLHRALILRSPSLGDSHDAFEPLLLFRSAHQGRPDGAAETAMLLLTDWRWRRGTGRLIHAIDKSKLVPEEHLDLLAHAFLAAGAALYWEVPAAWFDGPQLTLPSSYGARRRDPSGKANPPVLVARQVQPPLRRWAAARVVRAQPSAWSGVVQRARELDARPGAAVMQGLLDVVDVLPALTQDATVGLALEWPARAPRLAALEHLASHEQFDRAVKRACSDRDAAIRRWGHQLKVSPPPEGSAPDGCSTEPTTSRPGRANTCDEPATLF